MNITQRTRKNIEIGVLIGLICTIVLSMAHFDAACEDLRSNVLRLHIIANSDSDADQQLKLKVRDRILKESLNCFTDCGTLDDAIIAADINADKLGEIASTVAAEEGFKYGATVEVGNSDFDTRVYDDFTLPAGNYKSLIVRLGKSEGKNWWCVIFPTVCVPAASDSKLSDSTSEESAEIAENAPKYKMKFKIVEWYEEIKKAFS